MAQDYERSLSLDSIKTIVSAIHHVRPDWQPHDIAELFDQSDIPSLGKPC